MPIREQAQNPSIESGITSCSPTKGAPAASNFPRIMHAEGDLHAYPAQNRGQGGQKRVW
jgi:hypothetical protein